MAALIQRIHPNDNAIVALQPLKAGQRVVLGEHSWMLTEDIAAKHKFAAHDFSDGDRVTMYGVTVGRVRGPVRAGAWLSTANLEHATDAFTAQSGGWVWTAPDASAWKARTFAGYRRSDGRSGTANLWLVVPLVFCENRNIAVMQNALNRALGYHRHSPYESFARELVERWKGSGKVEALDQVRLSVGGGAGGGEFAPLFPGVGGIKFLQHTFGCGGTRQDSDALCRLIAGYINHPNVAGATVLSLGCQHSQIAILERELAALNGSFDKPLGFFEQQKSESEGVLLEKAMRFTFAGVAGADRHRREPCPISDLVVGVKCGGSDGFSGISANPVVGRLSDLLCASGGASVLSEFPELCGVESELCRRCETPELAERFARWMGEYGAQAQACGSGFDMNPSPGNIRDGLITDAIKSAGAATKGGTAPVVDVVDYAAPIRRKGGVSLLYAPGNDVECTTAMAGSGCNLILFTTGLGTPTGNPVCPVMKIATNTQLAERMSDIIDFDCGPVIRGEQTLEGMAEGLLELSLRVASGEVQPKAVSLGQDDFIPWKRGVSL
jgi:altronate hydrolase